MEKAGDKKEKGTRKKEGKKNGALGERERAVHSIGDGEYKGGEVGERGRGSFCLRLGHVETKHFALSWLALEHFYNPNKII